MAFSWEGHPCCALREPREARASTALVVRGAAADCVFPARRQSGSFLSTGWFTMILALELCEEIVVYGMVSDSYCRSGQPGPGQEGRRGGREDRGPHAGGSGSCGAQGVWASGWVVEAWASLELVPRGKGLSLWDWLDAHRHSARVAFGQTRHLRFLIVKEGKQSHFFRRLCKHLRRE